MPDGIVTYDAPSLVRGWLVVPDMHGRHLTWLAPGLPRPMHTSQRHESSAPSAIPQPGELDNILNIYHKIGRAQDYKHS